jgi:hypothetical protein
MSDRINNEIISYDIEELTEFIEKNEDLRRLNNLINSYINKKKEEDEIKKEEDELLLFTLENPVI